jgi:phage terminase large subunit-like protein
LLHLLDDEGIEGLTMRQGFKSMSEPTKELEALILSKKISHGGNPVLRWHCSNIELSIDASENIKIDKKKSREKVDGMVALVNAFACWNAIKSEGDGTSVYDTRGIRTL